MRVLVVEDESKVARFLKQALEEEGHAVDVADDGVEAGNLAHINPYDLILLDVQLPGGMDCRWRRTSDGAASSAPSSCSPHATPLRTWSAALTPAPTTT